MYIQAISLNTAAIVIHSQETVTLNSGPLKEGLLSLSLQGWRGFGHVEINGRVKTPEMLNKQTIKKGKITFSWEMYAERVSSEHQPSAARMRKWNDKLTLLHVWTPSSQSFLGLKGLQGKPDSQASSQGLFYTSDTGLYQKPVTAELL